MSYKYFNKIIRKTFIWERSRKMSYQENLQKDIVLARSELKNIRQEVIKLKAKLKKEVDDINLLLSKEGNSREKKQNVKDESENYFKMAPIGTITSCFKHKNGIPRQPSLCQSSKASLEINKTFFTNPEHSLIGLDEFSYIWILFVFHKNAESSIKAKVHPPRLNGKSVGVFSTRSPHRPCAIGLTLTKLDKIEGSTLYLSGIDILDGTPVLDIKPYIPSYDIPPSYQATSSFADLIQSFDSADSHTTCSNTLEYVTEEGPTENGHCDKISVESSNPDDGGICQTHASADNIGKLLRMPADSLEVLFTERALKDLEKFHSSTCKPHCNYCLNFIDSPLSAKQAIIEILSNDPRSVYRRKKCLDKLYYFEIDKLHVTCWFDETIVEVLKVKPVQSLTD